MSQQAEALVQRILADLKTGSMTAQRQKAMKAARQGAGAWKSSIRPHKKGHGVAKRDLETQNAA